MNRLQDENNKLTAETNVLEEEVTKLKDLEKDLEEITSAQGASADEFRQLVKENQELIEKQSVRMMNNYCFHHRPCLTLNFPCSWWF